MTRATAGNTTTETTKQRSERTGRPRNSAAVAKPRDTARISRSADPQRRFRRAQLLPNYASPTPTPHPLPREWPREWNDKPPLNRLRSQVSNPACAAEHPPSKWERTAPVALGIQVVRGRAFSRNDRMETQKVLMVNEAWVAKSLPAGNRRGI